MASYLAVAATCESIVKLLRSNYDPADFGTPLDFKVYTSVDFQKPMDTGVTVFPYRIYINGALRHPDGKILGNRVHQRPQLPLDIHFILTAWAKEASLQCAIAGWMLRVIDDSPVLPSGLLNSTFPNVFDDHETAEIVPGELSTEDMLRLWEALIQHSYRLSVPYIARAIRIESPSTVLESEPVRQRDYVYLVPEK